MSIVGKLWRIIGCELIFLVVFDIACVIASLVADILPMGGISTALFYAIWFVGGVFCGFLFFDTAGGWISPKSKTDWTKEPSAVATGRLICAVSTLLLTGLTVLFFRTLWRGGGTDEHYVPDSIPLTLTFFTAIVGATFVANSIVGPDGTRPVKRKA